MEVNKVSIYQRLMYLIVISSVFLLIFFSALYYVVFKQEKEVYQKAHTQFSQEIKSLMHLNSEFLTQNLKDKTFWDDLVNFVHTNDKVWFEDIVVPTLELYDLDYIGIYDLNKKLVRACRSQKINSFPKFTNALKVELDNKKFAHYYIKIPEGYGEVFIASIHPTLDYKRTSTPKGYYFVIRFIDKKYLHQLEQISSSSISIQNKYSTKLEDENTIQKFVSLKDFNGKVISNLLFKRNYDINFKNSSSILNVILIVVLINFIVFVYYIKHLVSIPIAQLNDFFKYNRKEDIELLKDAPGEFGAIGCLIEQSENRKIELILAKEKAEESDRLKSAFLANLSHEIRTPMNAIIGFADLLNNDTITDDEKKQYVQVIKKSGKSLTAIIEELIEMSKIDSQQIKPNFTVFDVNKLVIQIYNALHVTIPPDKKINFILENAIDKHLFINSDEIKINQILTNLLTNAIKFTNEGSIKFIFDKDDLSNKLIFKVIDSGCGIEEKDYKLIFERFKRVNNEYTVKIGGIGLGLPISKAYAKLLNGELHVQSKLNVGTEFEFILPVEIVENTIKNSNSVSDIDENENHTNFKILVAEDDNINFMLIEKLLKLKGYEVIRAKDGEEAVEICKSNAQIDLVLMDIKMPKMNGFEALTHIRDFSKVPIIAQTAYSLNEEKDKIMHAGFNGYITKPIIKEKLYTILQNTLTNK